MPWLFSDFFGFAGRVVLGVVGCLVLWAVLPDVLERLLLRGPADVPDEPRGEAK